MHLLRKLSLKSIQLNKKRTLMTVIGIALSCALIVAVAGMVSSAQATATNYIKEREGDYHALYKGVPDSALSYITQNTKVKTSRFIRHAGYAPAEASVNEYKPYFHLLTMDKETMKASAFHLTAGRFPENDTEIIVSAHSRTNGGIYLYVGDTLTLDLGTRTLGDGFVLTQEHPFDPETPERIRDQNRHTFTIVGIIERPLYTFESYEAPGYTVVTVDDNGTFAAESGDDTTDVLVTFTDAQTARNYAYVLYDTLNEVSVKEGREDHIVLFVENSDLIRITGGLNEDLLLMFLQIALIVIAIIIVTSVFVIRNSFRISVSEKTRQYGLLASVGATSRQIKNSVLYEGLLTGLIGVPLGLLIGALAVFVLIRLLDVIIANDLFGSGVHFVYALSPFVFVVAISLSALTIYLSSLIPARGAAKIAPVEAIRGNSEIHLNRKKVRTSRLIKKLFGTGGVIASNNLKRNRKKYRTTVVSLVLSISVFMAMSYFVDVLKEDVSYMIDTYGYNFYIGVNDEEDIREIAQMYDLTDYAYQYATSGIMDMETWGTDMLRKVQEPKHADPDNYDTWWLHDNEAECYLIFYNRDYFNRYLRENGVETASSQIALLLDEELVYRTNERGNIVQAAVEHYTTAARGDEMTLQIIVPEYIRDVTSWKEDMITRSYLAADAITEEDGTVVKTYIDEEMYLYPVTVPVVPLSGTRPMGLENWSPECPVFLLSDDMLPDDTRHAFGPGTMFINAPDPDFLEEEMMQHEWADAHVGISYWSNVAGTAAQNNRMILIVEIFAYGFITVITLIGVTNIFNTITTNMTLRSREFAMLKSVGMTSGQFNWMILLESVLYGARSLVIGVPLGVLLSYVIYIVLSGGFENVFFVPVRAMILSAVFVFLITGLTMRYSLGKINAQNTIETIRKEAI